MDLESIMVGKFKMVSTDNFDEYMKLMGVRFALRKMASTSCPIQEITIEDDKWTIRTTTTFKTTVITFRLGEEFEEETPGGRLVKTVMSINGHNLIQFQRGLPMDSVVTREFEASGFTMILTAGDVTARRIYKRLQIDQ